MGCSCQSRISPAKSDVAVGKSDQPAVGDGDAMGVSTEIAQHIFRSSEGSLGVDHPIVTEQHSQPGSEGARLSQRQEVAVELKRTSMEGVAQPGDELAAEDTAEHADRQEEGSVGRRSSWSGPVRGRRATTRWQSGRQSRGPWWSQDDSKCASGCRERATPWACDGGCANKFAALRAASH